MNSRIFHRVKSSKFLKSLTTLMSGTLVAQLLTLAATPVLSRLYTQKDYGTFGTIVSIAALIAVVAAGKYEMALVIDKSSQAFEALKRLCFYLITATTILALGAITVCYFWAPELSINEETAKALPFIPPMIAITAFYSFSTFCLNRSQKYPIIAKAAIWQKTATLSLQIGMALLGFHYGLHWGFVIGFLIALLWMLRNGGTCLKIAKTSTAEIRAVALKHKRFPFYTVPQSFLNFFSQNLPVYLLGFYFGLTTVGAYWFTMRILQMPVGLVGNAVRQVFFKDAADLQNQPEVVLEKLKKSTSLLALVILPITIIVTLWAPDIFTFVFGSKWQNSGQYARWMILWVSFLFINPPAVMIYNVFQWQNLSLIHEVAIFISRAAALIIGGLYLSSLETIALYSIVGVIANIYVISIAFYKLKKLTKEKRI